MSTPPALSGGPRLRSPAMPTFSSSAHRGAYLEYRHQPIAVGIDIYNLEAEAYGAKVELVEGDAIPAIYPARC